MLLFKNRWHRNYFIRRYVYGPLLGATSTFLYRLRFVPITPLERPIFIVGVSRSGTTMFTDYFRRHDDLCNWSEAAQILESDFYNTEIDTVRTEHDVSSLDTFRIRFFFGTKTLLTRKTRFVNKHPENSLRIRFLRRIFPDAMFVHLIRNGWPTIASNYKRTCEDPFRTKWPFGQFPKPPNWRNYLTLPPIEQFAHQWVDVIQYVRTEAEQCLSPEDYIEIRYEAFCAQPRDVIQTLDDFCGLSKGGRRHDEIPHSLRNLNSRWRSVISGEEKQKIAEIIEPLNRALGYYDNWFPDVWSEEPKASETIGA